MSIRAVEQVWAWLCASAAIKPSQLADPPQSDPCLTQGNDLGAAVGLGKELKNARAKKLLVRFCRGKCRFHFAHSKCATSDRHLLCKKRLSVRTVASPGEHCTVTAQEPGKGTAMQSSPGIAAVPPWAARTHLLH